MLLQETITGTLLDTPGPGFPVLGEGGKCPSFGSPQGQVIQVQSDQAKSLLYSLSIT